MKLRDWHWVSGITLVSVSLCVLIMDGLSYFRVLSLHPQMRRCMSPENRLGYYLIAGFEVILLFTLAVRKFRRRHQASIRQRNVRPSSPYRGSFHGRQYVATAAFDLWKYVYLIAYSAEILLCSLGFFMDGARGAVRVMPCVSDPVWTLLLCFGAFVTGCFMLLIFVDSDQREV